MRNRHLTNKTKINAVDKVAYIAGIGAVVIYIPQIIKIWVEDNVSGLSIITWAGFIVGAVIWLFYGIVHKQKVIIFSNIMLIITQLIVIAGIILKS